MLHLLRNWKSCLDKGGVIGAVLMDLSKAYDCLPHDLLIAKLEAYGFDLQSLTIILNYLSNRKQRVKINSIFSEWISIILGVPQGSILGPILFNIFINDLFLVALEIGLCNFADDNTAYSCEETMEIVAIKLENNVPKILRWFKLNSMVVNPSKFQAIFLGNKGKSNLCIEIDGSSIKPNKEVKLLGVTIDKDLNFNSHVRILCRQANQKVNALLRIRNYLSLKKNQLLCNAYILSPFNYCNLIWMFCDKHSNHIIRNVQKRALRLLHGNFNKSFEELLHITGSTTIHVKNLQSLMTEVYKSIHHINPEFMWDLFCQKCIPYNLRISNLLVLPKIKSSKNGLNSFIFRGSILWNTVPDYIKSSKSVTIFKSRIKIWRGNLCSCRLCV